MNECCLLNRACQLPWKRQREWREKAREAGESVRRKREFNNSFFQLTAATDHRRPERATLWVFQCNDTSTRLANCCYWRLRLLFSCCGGRFARYEHLSSLITRAGMHHHDNYRWLRRASGREASSGWKRKPRKGWEDAAGADCVRRGRSTALNGTHTHSLRTDSGPGWQEGVVEAKKWAVHQLWSEWTKHQGLELASLPLQQYSATVLWVTAKYTVPCEKVLFVTKSDLKWAFSSFSASLASPAQEMVEMA